MHKLDFPTKPDDYDNAITKLALKYPPTKCANENERWSAFRNESGMYHAVCENLMKNQNGICAYCEIPLNDRNKQVEHFIPKSLTTKDNDYTYNFSNMLLCCVGGTNPHSRKSGEFSNNPTAKANHSCGEAKGDTDPIQICLNPYELPEHLLFTAALDLEGIKLIPDTHACEKANITEHMVKNTIDLLNLNCPRLIRRRGQIWKQLETEIQEIKNLTDDEQGEAFSDLKQAYLYDNPAFYTTKKIYFDSY